MSSPKTFLGEGAWASEPSSLVDSIGRVIYHDGRVLRGIRDEYAVEFRKIVDLAERHHWFDHGLVPTWVTQFETDEFSFVLEHQRIPFVTTRVEWPAEALRRAALRYLELSSVIARSGYCLKDAHPWNVLFAGATPVVTDFASIRPIGELNLSAWLTEFRNYFLAPLLIFARGESALARALLREHLVGVGLWLINNAPDKLFSNDFAFVREEPHGAIETFDSLRELINGLVLTHTPTEWTGYAQPATTAPSMELRYKDRLVKELLDRLAFETAIDLGASRGLHAWMCADKGASVLACDIDEMCLDAMYLRAVETGDNVLSLYVNVVLPAPAGGAFQTIAPATQRLQCDLVLALALVHHVCLRSQFSVDSFVRGVAAFTRRAAIVEFVPADDWHVTQWGVPIPPGYSLDGFHRALARLFHRVERIASEPSPRHIFVCEEKR